MKIINWFMLGILKSWMQRFNEVYNKRIRKFFMFDVYNQGNILLCYHLFIYIS